jgi:hypothetical protein
VGRRGRCRGVKKGHPGHVNAGASLRAEQFTRAEAQKCVRCWSQSRSGIILSDHASERMFERGIDWSEVQRILREGSLQREFVQTDHGEWKCKMTLQIDGDRAAGVVVLVLRASGVVFVKTVQWEDYH